MPQADPRTIIRQIEQLRAELERWTRASGQTLNDARREQHQAAGAVADIRGRGAQLDAEVARLESQLAQASADTERACSDQVEAMRLADAGQNRAESCYDEAQQTSGQWRDRLATERAALDRARHELDRARTALRMAEAELAAARASLAAAEGQLAAARSDKKGDTGYAQGAVAVARGRVMAAEGHVMAAVQAVREAELEVGRSERRVAICEDTVVLCDQAVREGQGGLDTARDAETEAERAGSMADELQDLADDGKTRQEQASNDLRALFESVSEAEQGLEQANERLVNAEAARGEIERATTGARHDLDEAIEELREVDRGDGLAAVGVLGAVVLGALAAMGPTRQQVGAEAERREQSKARSEVAGRRLNLHHAGNQGIDNAMLFETARGATLRTNEVKATANPDSRATPGRVLALLKTDSRGLQQGSRSYSQDRLRRAAASGNRSARMVLGRMARAGEGRIWQTRNYVTHYNLATGERTQFRVISSVDGNRVARLETLT